MKGGDLQVERLMNPKEVAQSLNVSLPTVYSWAAKGFLRSRKIGRCVRFRVADVEEVMQLPDEKRGEE
jgi:excisionase family DNA binding protein